jgi:hypothetical protein
MTGVREVTWVTRLVTRVTRVRVTRVIGVRVTRKIGAIFSV